MELCAQVFSADFNRFNCGARQTLNENTYATVGQLQHAHDDGHSADAVKVFARRLFLIKVALRGEQNHAVLAQGFVNGAYGFLARDKERHDHKRIDNYVAQRQHGQIAWNLQLLLAAVSYL